MEQNLKEEINNKIKYFEKINVDNPEQLNEDQLMAIKSLLNRVLTFEELNVWTHLLEQRVGFGFKFDEAPHLKNPTKIPVLVKSYDQEKRQYRSFEAQKVPSWNDNGKTPQPYFNCWGKLTGITKFTYYLL